MSSNDSFCGSEKQYFLSLFQKRNTEVIDSKVEELKKQMRGEKLFIADSVESPDRGSIQFFGEPFNVSIGPGMTLVDLDGREHRIEEVYLKVVGFKIK